MWELTKLVGETTQYGGEQYVGETRNRSDVCFYGRKDRLLAVPQDGHASEEIERSERK